MDEGSQKLGVLAVGQDETTTAPEVVGLLTEVAKEVLLEKLRKRVALWTAKERSTNLPEGNSYCLYCGCLCFVLPRKNVATVLVQFCRDCIKLQGFGLI